MSFLALLRKGFGYVLMALGASSPESVKKKPAAKPTEKPISRG